MTERIVDLSNEPARLRVKHAQLVVEREGQEPATVPLEEIAVLVLANPQIVCSNAVLTGVMEQGGIVVACNARCLPAGWMLPVEGHHLQAERFRQQATAHPPTQKRLWQQVVRAKLKAQGRLLEALHGDDAGLGAMAERVKSGDPDNVEAQAARRYWPKLFDGQPFHRDRDAEDANRHLNYGYIVLRAIIARAVCAAGLHPSLGLHHHNRYDPYALAADLMEPFRPIVDEAVYRYVREHGHAAAVDTQAKRHLITALYRSFPIQGEWRSLFDIAARAAASLAKAYAGEAQKIVLPAIAFGDAATPEADHEDPE